MENNDELDIQHRLIIEEEDIDISELPKEIINAIRNFNIKLERYEETDDTDLFFQLQQDDVAIADDIQTFIEDNESDDEEEDDSYVNEEEEEEEEPQQIQGQAQQTNVEQIIYSRLKNNLISVEELKGILRREPDYPTEQIGKLKLRKLYLKPFYEAF